MPIPKAKVPKNPTKIPIPLAFFLFTNAKTLPLITSIVLMKIWISESSIRFVKISMYIISTIGTKPRAKPPKNSTTFELRETFGTSTDSSVNGELIVKSTSLQPRRDAIYRRSHRRQIDFPTSSNSTKAVS